MGAITPMPLYTLSLGPVYHKILRLPLFIALAIGYARMAVTMMAIFIVFSPECRREGHWDWSQSYRSFGIGVDLPRALAFLLKVS